MYNVPCSDLISLSDDQDDDQDDDCFVVGPDAGCDGVCFSGLEEDCLGECGGSATVDAQVNVVALLL